LDGSCWTYVGPRNSRTYVGSLSFLVWKSGNI